MKRLNKVYGGSAVSNGEASARLKMHDTFGEESKTSAPRESGSAATKEREFSSVSRSQPGMPIPTGINKSRSHVLVPFN